MTTPKGGFEIALGNQQISIRSDLGQPRPDFVRLDDDRAARCLVIR
jgi:hypothetical protein